LSYPLREHMCVFDRQAGEQQNREGFEQSVSESASGCGEPEGKFGAAVWADLRIAVVQPDGWPVYHLQMGLQQLERLRRETEAAMALLTGAMPQSRDTVADIARSSGVSNREARRRKSVADVCGKIKGALEKLQSGAISPEHVSALAPVVDLPGAERLLDEAESKSPEELTRDVEEFRLSFGCGDDMAKRQRARRYLRFFAGPEGMVGINGLLPPVEGSELKSRLAAMVDAQWRKEHPERARVCGGHEDDTYDQRTADALLAMAGIYSPAAGASVSNGAPPVDNAAAEEGLPTTNGTQGSSVGSSGIHGETEAEITTPTGNSANVLPRTNRPTEALPMKAGLRLVGLAFPPATLGREQSGLAFEDIDAKQPRDPVFDLTGPISASLRVPSAGSFQPASRIGNPRNDAIRGPVPGKEKSLGVIVKTAKPAVVIVFDVDRWKARIAGGGPIPITESLLDQARNDLYYCFKNTAGEAIKFARSRRDPTPVQRLVLVVRDEKCLYPGCHTPPDACDAHHLNEVVKDRGRTDTDVMGLFCEAHHRHIHLNDLVVKRNANGTITIIERRTGTEVVSSQPRREAA
jgi:hypothetical protein